MIGKLVRGVACVVGVVGMFVLVPAVPAMAQGVPPGAGARVVAQVPDAAADGTMPGAKIMQKFIGWGKFGALGTAVLAMLAGAISAAVGHFGNNYGAAAAAKKWFLGGMLAAIVQGMAVGLVSQLAGSV